MWKQVKYAIVTPVLVPPLANPFQGAHHPAAEDQQGVMKGPLLGEPDAPPLGAPRAKLTPGEPTPDEDD